MNTSSSNHRILIRNLLYALVPVTSTLYSTNDQRTVIEALRSPDTVEAGPPGLTATIMNHDHVLELSVEHLVRALNEKLFMECARVQSTVPPVSPAFVATFTAEVRLSNLKIDTSFDKMFYRLTLWRDEPKTF
jgi:hypothetical protein